MGLGFTSKKEEKDELYENLKILATNIETLNKQINGNTNTINNNSRLEQKVDMLINVVGFMNQQNQGNIKLLAELRGSYIDDRKRMDEIIKKNLELISILKNTIDNLNEVINVIKEDNFK